MVSILRDYYTNRFIQEGGTDYTNRQRMVLYAFDHFNRRYHAAK